MDIQTLISIASARGIDLDLGKPRDGYEIPAAHLSGPRRRAVEPPNGTSGDQKPITIPGVYSALGRQSAARHIPRWTKSDLGFAMSGASTAATHAFYWCINEDERAGGYLRWRLFEFALELKERQRWPEKLKRARCAGCLALRCSHRYVEDVVSLAMIEGAYPGAFGSLAVRAEWFGLSETHFRRAIGPGYAGVYGKLDNWWRLALSNLKRRLRTDESVAQSC
jgi:hypothetical protein